jgi:hypothetical protein
MRSGEASQANLLLFVSFLKGVGSRAVVSSVELMILPLALQTLLLPTLARLEERVSLKSSEMKLIAMS